MNPALLEHLFSHENEFNVRYGAPFPLYKFCKLYEERDSLSDKERESRLFVENETRSGFYVLNPFFISLLRDHSIWFAPATAFNDPWDAGAAVSILEGNADLEASTLKLLFGDSAFEQVADLPREERSVRIAVMLRDVFSLLRFACFTRRLNCNPMWAHYADNHRGVCLQFLFMKSAAAPGVDWMIDPSFTGHYEVRYDNDFTQVRDVENIGSAVQLLHTKHPDWAYEKEVRFIKFGNPDHPGVGGIVSFYKSSLVRVILGCKVPPPLWRAIEIILDEYGYAHTDLVRSEFDYRTQSLKYLIKNRKLSAS